MTIEQHKQIITLAKTDALSTAIIALQKRLVDENTPDFAKQEFQDLTDELLDRMKQLNTNIF